MSCSTQHAARRAVLQVLLTTTLLQGAEGWKTHQLLAGWCSISNPNSDYQKGIFYLCRVLSDLSGFGDECERCAQCVGYLEAVWPGITWTFLGHIRGRILIVVSLRVCSGPNKHDTLLGLMLTRKSHH